MCVRMSRRVGRRVGVHSGHHLVGALLRHLSPTDVPALADAPARLSHDLSRMGRLAHCHDADRRLPETASHADRRPQVRRNLGRPQLGEGIYLFIIIINLFGIKPNTNAKAM